MIPGTSSLPNYDSSRKETMDVRTSLLATSTTTTSTATTVLSTNPNINNKSVVNSTVADLFVQTPKLFMFYHVIGTSYDFLSPVGFVVGGLIHSIGIYKPFPSIIQTMTTSSVLLGCIGSTVGTIALCNTIYKGESATPIPWNDNGIQQRVTKLSNNYKVRVMDQSVWTGIVVGCIVSGTASVLPITKKYIPFSSGILGTIQAIQLGAVTGSLYGLACITAAAEKRNSATK